MSGQLHAPADLPLGEEPVDRRLGGPEIWLEHGGKEKKIKKMSAPARN